jgi:hypothetical protein
LKEIKTKSRDNEEEASTEVVHMQAKVQIIMLGVILGVIITGHLIKEVEVDEEVLLEAEAEIQPKLEISTGNTNRHLIISKTRLVICLLLIIWRPRCRVGICRIAILSSSTRTSRCLIVTNTT